MKIKIDLLNILTGFTLLVVGIIDIVGAQYIRVASWIIFGSMYLVMDSYGKRAVGGTFFERIASRIRYIFGWVGLMGSVALSAYRLWARV